MNLVLKHNRLFLSLAVSCSLLACSHNTPAPVSELSNFNPAQQKLSTENQTVEAQPEYYIVKPGDTLFSIAWYYSLDHRDLALINHIDKNTIYPGQKLLLKSKVEQPYFNAESLILALNEEVLKTPVKYSPPQKLAVHNTRYTKKSRRALKNHLKASTQTSAKIVSTSYSKNALASEVNSPAANRPAIPASKLNFIWPTEGKVIEGFSSNNNANRGLDIAAKRGQAVRATAPGRVVYRGNGLRGYGNLVIIKHDNDYLSAYAHNERIHVTENEFVKAGQRIADIGSSGTQQEKLHFEIRYKGKPVDPLNYLPQK